MKKLIIVMLSMIVVMFCGSPSFAEVKDIDLDAPPGMFIKYPIEITNQTALRITMKCVEKRKHDEWSATFGIIFISEDKDVFFSFSPDPSNEGVFEAYLEHWQGGEMISSANRSGRRASRKTGWRAECRDDRPPPVLSRDRNRQHRRRAEDLEASFTCRLAPSRV